MKDKMGLHCLISGKVQNVWFRANTQKEAKKLGLTGWVRNLPDGRVEAMICGPQAQIETLKTWLRHGPERAEVTDLQCEERPWQTFDGFDVT